MRVCVREFMRQSEKIVISVSSLIFLLLFFCTHSFIDFTILCLCLIFIHLKVYNCFIFSVSSHSQFFSHLEHVKVHSYQCEIVRFRICFFIPSIFFLSTEKKTLDFEIIAHIILSVMCLVMVVQALKLRINVRTYSGKTLYIFKLMICCCGCY